MVATARRPGWVTFAAVISFTSAVMYGLVALTEFANSRWFLTVNGATYNLFSSHFFWWGLIDAAICALAVIAGLALLQGADYGVWLAFLGAGVSMFRWMFYIPATPWLALMIIVLDILVIYGICVSLDWFDRRT